MPVPTNLEEALAMLTASGSDKITGAELREVITWLSGEVDDAAGDVTQGELDTEIAARIAADLVLTNAIAAATAADPLASFTSLLRFDTRKRMVFSGNGSEACVLALDAAGGHVEGVTVSVFIPAGEAGSLRTGGDLNTAAWDPFVPSSDYLVTCLWTNDSVFSAGKNQGLRDTVAPTIVSATVDSSAPTSLVLVFSEPVIVPALTGLSLVFSAGTSRTLTAVASGQGTDTITFTLSGAFDGSEVVTFDRAAGRVLQDLNGNLIATGSTSIDVDGFSLGGALPDATHLWRGDEMSGSGAGFTVADQIGSLDLMPNGVATPPTASTMGTNAVACWLIGASASSLSADPVSGEVMTSGTMACVVDLTNENAATALMSAGADGSESALHNLIYRSSSGESHGAYVGGGSAYGFTQSLTGIHDIIVTWAPAGGTLYVDGVAVTTFGAVTVANLGRYVVGAQSDRNAWCAADMKFRDFQITNTLISAGDATDYHAYHAAEVGY
jgi:hypothetical protein